MPGAGGSKTACTAQQQARQGRAGVGPCSGCCCNRLQVEGVSTSNRDLLCCTRGVLGEQPSLHPPAGETCVHGETKTNRNGRIISRGRQLGLHAWRYTALVLSCCCIAGVQFLRPRDERSYSWAVSQVCPVRLGLPLDSAHCNASDCPVEASPSPPLPLASLPCLFCLATPCLVLMVRFNFRTWANHDRRPRTAPPSGTQYSTLDGWGNVKSSVAPLLCRADASFAGARGLVQRAILGHGIHVTLYRSHIACS